MCYVNKGKSQRFGKINNNKSRILISQRLSKVLDIDKVGYSNYKLRS